jgi:tetratricopeptide (TPR) repeat protein
MMKKGCAWLFCLVFFSAAAAQDAAPVGALDWFNQGVELARNGEHQAALVRFERARAISPAWALPYIEIATCHMLLGSDRQLVEENLKKAVQLGPEMPRAHYLYGIFLQNSGDTKQAVSEFVQALKLRPSLIDARFRLALLYLEQGRQPQALEQLEFVVQQSPNHLGARKNLALLYEQAGQLEEAEKHLKAMSDFLPESAFHLEQLAKFYERTGMKAKAAAARRQLEKLDGQHDKKMRPLLPSRDVSGARRGNQQPPG